MKALIFNSGLGSRLGELTAHKPKSLVTLADGETIFSRQLRILMTCGISDFVVTTGPFEELIRAEAEPFVRRGAHISFVPNPVYDQTNYIYSMYLAREELRGQDILLLHGDLVFDAAFVRKMLASPEPSLGAVNATLPQPEKDFKARVIGGEVREVGVGIFDANCIAFQALYKLSAGALDIWLDAVEAFVEAGTTGVYAENAANTVYDRMHVKAFSYADDYVEEIDTPEDLARVSADISTFDYEHQPVFVLEGARLSLSTGTVSDELAGSSSLERLIGSLGMRRPLVVVDGFFSTQLDQLLGGVLADLPTFSDYAPNPRYEQIVTGVNCFRKHRCDGVISLGGGSAIDVAKCIKLFAPLDSAGTAPRFTSMELGYSPIPHLAIPSTAGTGSESTHFAVTYVDGEKISVAHPCIHPDAVVLAPQLLYGLPAYQKRATLLDALCQAIESYWSTRSSVASRKHSRAAIVAILSYVDAYLDDDRAAAKPIMLAANQAGKAINLTTTTAAHAMSYKITSLYGLAHGHAVALCLPLTWQVLIERGDEQARRHLHELDVLLTGDEAAELGAGLQVFEELYASMSLAPLHEDDDATLDLLAQSVNVQRLSNFPVALETAELKEMYRTILG